MLRSDYAELIELDVKGEGPIIRLLEELKDKLLKAK